MPTVDVDQRRVVGARVKAKAVHVTSESEAARRYGQLSKTKMVFGTVLSVDTFVHAVAPDKENQQPAPAESPNEPTGTNNDDNPTGTNTHNASVASPGAFAGNN
ncbi:hypothetical protein IV203_012607 [Nitzschia inconspicua]|uniref:Uncharacterized protein n=1 Tax=Nitzschia inconspicua TaxID=303405 RepID=A0A9K3KVL8_9STRA|nr:hypothetical protein IV203_012607 [Nitzschia inconspicua]